MKKHGLTKILAIIILLTVIASYLIKGRQGISQIALGDGIMNYFQSFYYFDVVLFILVVGGFYGILEHVPAYTKLQENIANKVKNKKLVVFAIIIIFALLSSLTGLNLLLLIFIPFAISLILALGYDKLVALFSTVGSVAVGLIGGIFTTIKMSNSYYGTTYSTFEELVGLEDKWVNVIPKVILLVVAVALLIFFVNSYIKKTLGHKQETKKPREEKKELVAKVETKKEVVKEPKKETKKEVKQVTNKKTTTSKKSASVKNTTKKKTTKKNLSAAKPDETIVIKKTKKTRIWPLVVLAIVLLVFLVLGYLPWNSLFGITVFDDFHTWVTELSIGKYTIFTSLISQIIPAFGNWGGIGSSYLIAMFLLVIIAIIIKFVYKIKFDDILDYCLEGMKKMLPALLVAMLAYTVLVCTYNNGFMETIITSATDKFGDNIMIHSLISILGSITNVDMYYTSVGIFTPIINGLSDSANLQVFAVAFQSLFGLMQIIGPTSILLVICLAYTDVSYKDWFKNIWKFVLILFIVICAVMLLTSML